MLAMKITFTRLLMLGFGVIMLAGLGTLLYLGVAGTERNTRQLLAELVQSTMSSLAGQVRQGHEPVEEQLRYLQRQLAKPQISTGDRPSIRLLLKGALAATPEVLSISFITAGSERLHVSRDDTTPVDDHWQQRQAQQIDRYLQAPPDDITWLEPLWSSRLNHTVIPVLMPVWQQDQFRGLLGAAISIESISDFFEELSGQIGMKVFALYGQQRVLAYPELAEHSRIIIGPENPMPRLADMKNQAMAEIWNPARRPLEWMRLEGIDGHSLRLDDIEYVYFYQRQTMASKTPWILGIYLEQEEMPEWMKRMVMIAGLGLLLIVILLVLVGWMSRRIGAGVERIAGGFDAVREQELEDIPPLPGSRVVEFDRVATAYNRMLADMKEHQTVQKLFGQYVPESIARALIRNQGALEPQQARATVFFVDLEGFTALSEKLDPPQIVAILNSFFSDIVAILERHGGLITQFQGDAVLAIFNVPAAQSDHADRAYRAAMEIQRLVSSKIYNGQRLCCRIGINTGDVVAGSVGARDRLNYTVHGDAVNLAARLETLNKNYRTRVLISDTTVEMLTVVSAEQLVSIGEVQVRGRQHTLTVYTPRELLPDRSGQTSA